MIASPRRHTRWLVAAALLALAATMWALPVTAASTVAEAQGDAAGAEVFQANCAVCHGPAGEGGMGGAPPLAGVVERLGREQVEVTIRQGRRGMPTFEGQLADAEIAAVIGYVERLPREQAAPRDPGRRGPRWDGMWDRMPGGDGMMGRWRGIMLLLLTLFSVALLVLVILGVVWLTRNRRPAEGQRRAGSLPSGAPTVAREALDLRYARGEISREEYLQARDDLDDRRD